MSGFLRAFSSRPVSKIPFRNFRSNIPRINVPSKVVSLASSEATGLKKWSIKAKEIVRDYGITFILLRAIINMLTMIGCVRFFIDYMNLEKSDSAKGILTWVLGEERKVV